MRLTRAQLNKMIMNEARMADRPGVAAGAFAQAIALGKTAMKRGMIGLSDAEFKKLEVAMRDAAFERQKAEFGGIALTPSGVAKKMAASLRSTDWRTAWSWVHQSPKFTDALEKFLDEALGPTGAADASDFFDALTWLDEDTGSDVYEDMSQEEADENYVAAQERMESIIKLLRKLS